MDLVYKDKGSIITIGKKLIKNGEPISKDDIDESKFKKLQELGLIGPKDSEELQDALSIEKAENAKLKKENAELKALKPTPKKPEQKKRFGGSE